MIPAVRVRAASTAGKPRASGDDPVSEAGLEQTAP